MKRIALLLLGGTLLVSAAGSDERASGLTAADLAGVWQGLLSHAGETESYGLELEPGGDGTLRVKLSVPILYLAHREVGQRAPQIEGNKVTLGPFKFLYDNSVVAAPAVDSRHVFFGSFDGNVYALDTARGQLIWKRDMRAPVTSTPAIDGDLLLIGSRAYDFEALKTSNGGTAWNRYVWFS
jgi:outer membrane protein assembly factor BamB